MKRIGVTGGIGAGKSVVCKIFSALGIPVYNADNAARHLMNENEELRNELNKLFGDQVFNEKQEVNRGYIAATVFNNEDLLQKLNSLVHPVVHNDFTRWENAQHAAYTIREAAILFETGIYTSLDYVILVDAPSAIRIERVKRRDGRTLNEIELIIKRQWTSEEKRKLAWRVIENDDEHLLIPQVLAIHQAIIND